MRPIVRNASFSDRDLYLVRPHFGDTIADCVSFALSAEYRISGKLIVTDGDIVTVAAGVGKILCLYRAGEVDIITANEKNGVGYVYLHEDLNGNFTVVCWKDEEGALVTVSSKTVTGER